MVFSREDKIKIIRALDALGVDYIEAGNPASNPRTGPCSPLQGKSYR